MSKGIVQEYYIKRGFGSIIDSETGQKLTVYANYIDLVEGETLKEGQEVEYDVQRLRNERWAVNVRFSVKQVEANKVVAA